LRKNHRLVLEKLKNAKNERILPGSHIAEWDGYKKRIRMRKHQSKEVKEAARQTRKEKRDTVERFRPRDVGEEDGFRYKTREEEYKTR